MFGRTAGAGRKASRIATMAAAACVTLGLLTAGAQAEVRTLKFYNLHTKERASFAFKRNGRYDRAELEKINWFLRDWRKAKATKMDPRLMDLVWEAYRQSGSNDYINVICGFRSPATNAMLRSRTSGVARESQHTAGKALDFFIPDVPLSKMRAIGLKMEVGGVGYYPRSGSPFVHFDVGNARHWPRMSRKELVAVFPKGNTIHVPSDGKPLPGYQQALVAYQKRRGASDLQIANATKSGGGRSFLAMLFKGGGADEADDEAEAVVAPAPAAPKVRERAAPPQPETAIAAAPTPPARLPGGVSVPVPDTYDVGVPAPRTVVPAAVEPEAGTQIAALTRVPRPTFAPSRAAPAAPLAETTAVAALANVPVPSDPAVTKQTDAVATLVAALDGQAKESVASGQMAYAVPMPSERPAFASVMNTQAAMPSQAELERAVAAVTPKARPAAAKAPADLQLLASAPRDAVAAVIEMPKVASAATSKPALLTPAVATTQVDKPAKVAALSAPKPAAVSPSGKSGRVQRSDAAAKPKAVPVPAAQAIASRIDLAYIVADPDDRALAAMKRPMAGRLVSERPEAVFVDGFSAESKNGKSDRFSGKAVNFLPVARVQ